jgi:hypothetical protein
MYRICVVALAFALLGCGDGATEPGQLELAGTYSYRAEITEPSQIAGRRQAASFTLAREPGTGGYGGTFALGFCGLTQCGPFFVEGTVANVAAQRGGAVSFDFLVPSRTRPYLSLTGQLRGDTIRGTFRQLDEETGALGSAGTFVAVRQ